VRLKQLREAKGWSQAALAEKVGVTREYIARLERVRRFVALPPLRLGVRVQRLKAHRSDPLAKTLAEHELRLARTIRTRLAREGWSN